jgi:hypothetical protein
LSPLLKLYELKTLRTSFIKTLLVVLYVSFYIGNTCFLHTHHFPTYSITHSHPFLPSSDGSPQHTHSQAAFELIAQVNSIAFDLTPFFVLSLALTSFAVLDQLYQPLAIIRATAVTSLRAPPACI